MKHFYILFLIIFFIGSKLYAQNTPWQTSGPIGIGTTSTSAGPKLTVRSGVNALPATTGNIQPGAGLRIEGGDNAVIDFGTNSVNTWIQATDKLGLGLAYMLSLNPNGGFVGVGKSNPAYTLDVNGVVNTNQYFTSTGGVYTSNTSNGFNSAAGAAYLSFRSNNVDSRMVIDPTGNVGIGTTDPKGYKLAVNGSMIATAVTVKTYGTWPDYVFKKNYDLRSLTEVKNYINNNQHLPEIPSAEEITKEGINLGEMNKLLLKKVEELTLYLIEKDEKETRQKATIDKQGRRIDRLEQQLRQLISKGKQ
ncbi:MAG: hypothetical protein AAGC65_01785 [Mucilaginibacter sp.]|uniref:hypothetical protein n=1 Tax=Mucilaginibacter sp. TaxID=1882438 RepID=UPI0031A37558